MIIIANHVDLQVNFVVEAFNFQNTNILFQLLMEQIQSLTVKLLTTL